jgi:hypothetical protein
MEALDSPRQVRAGGRLVLAWCFDAETGDVVVAWPSDVSLDMSAGLPSPPSRRLLRRGEYEPEPPHDRDFSWPTAGPCVQLPAGGVIHRANFGEDH